MSLLVDDNNLPSKVTKEDRILIFFSGHGISIPNRRNNRKTGYIVPYDGNASAINSLIDFNDLVQKSVDNLVAKHILFLLDCCFSGIATLRSIPTDKPSIPPVPINDYLETCTSKETVQVISAGGADELVLDQNVLTDHSPFAESIISGLDSWDADIDKNGVITSSELAVYLAKRVSDLANVYGHMQKPIANRLRGDQGGDFVIRVSPNLPYETLQQFRDRIEHLSMHEYTQMIKEETGCIIRSSIIADVVAASYISYATNPKQLQLEIILLLKVIARMFVPLTKYRLTIERPNVPAPDRAGTDLPETLSLDVSTDVVQSFLEKKISIESMWAGIRFFVKESDTSTLKINEVLDFNLVI